MASDQDGLAKTDVRDAVYHTLSVQESSISTLQDTETVAEITRVAEVISEEDGRVVFSGIGKSGDVGKKVSSTFNSIGVSSHFIHPVEALHGDLGALSAEDVVVLISNSGNTDEMVELLQFLRSFDATTVSITSDPESKLGTRADYHINTKIEEEGAVVELVPMASATSTMVIGDCIANALMANRDFSEQDYGHFHPGGTIGKRLLLTVEDLLHKNIPKTRPADTLAKVALKISEGGKGIAVVQDDDDYVKGVLTDGDIRRFIESGTDFHDVVAEEVMITDPITTSVDMAAIRALEVIEEKNISQLVVTDDSDQFLGVVHIHDIMERGLTA
ncbi:KpsF/GutQ family sugar-phosphate isomerase [Halodesulfurarchaeum formicicum]|uniref:Arabinose-5-phosphate isomerase n=1 Tax=Halodesulfurarchaeum formicicum TaxID=1873524 RepID=A0A1J1AB19_9EURY|nr:KpsF/GutQ family sugar-phosphate isomerase [Halodesulfurarchaeum formicicum]APE95330.1 arabinose-5-phosphate isomerase [Halodesulfurarchaeum formicicum]